MGAWPRIRYDTYGFTPHEQDVLVDYARLAAAALDSAVSVEESRRQAATARSLLDLSQALAELTSVDEIARLDLRTVTSTIGCDRSVLVLTDSGRAARADRRLLRLSVRRREPARGPRPGSPGQLEAWWRAGFRRPGPHRGRPTVWPCRSRPTAKSSGPSSLPTRPDTRCFETIHGTGELLRGLAAQAATAVRNTRLVDHIRHQAAHDGLTGLANRTRVFEQAEQVIARCQRAGSAPAALYVDLDGFKFVNDTLGHQAGDDLLRMVAGRMTACLRPTDTVGRLGRRRVHRRARQRRGGCGPRRRPDPGCAPRAPFKLPGHDDVEVMVTASIGIATGPTTIRRHCSGTLTRRSTTPRHRARTGTSPTGPLPPRRRPPPRLPPHGTHRDGSHALS